MATNLHREQTEELIAKATAVANQALRPMMLGRRARRRWVPVAIACSIAVLGIAVVGLTRAAHRVSGTIEPPIALATANDNARVEDAATTVPINSTTGSVASRGPAVLSPAVPSSAVPPSVVTTGPVEPFTFEIEADGRAHMRGAVPDQQVAATLRASAAAVLGSKAIVEEFVIDPRAQLDVEGIDRGWVTQTLFFPSGLAGLQDDQVSDLDVVVLILIRNPQVTAYVEGFTDSIGDDPQNAALAAARGRRVIEYLSGKGVPPGQLIEVTDAGDADPRGDNSTVIGRAKNRRVDIYLAAT